MEHGRLVEISHSQEPTFNIQTQGLFVLWGSGVQNITSVSTAFFPNLEFASSGTVNLIGEIKVGSDLTYTSGTINAGTSRITMSGASNSATIDAAGVTFNDFKFDKSDLNSVSSNKSFIVPFVKLFLEMKSS